MNEMQVFNYSNNEVRTVIKDGAIWFVAKDVCVALGISNTSDAVARLEPDEVTRFNLGSQAGEVNIISESGLYSLTLGSKKPEAKPFKRWVTHEVLPDIRKHGIYATQDTVENMLNNPDFMIELLTNYKAEKEARIEAERRNAVLMHVQKVYTTTELAKELGFKSAIALNTELSKNKIQFKQNSTWVLYSKYADLGYTDIKQTVLDTGRIVYDRKWTQSGRDFVVTLFCNKVD